MRPAHLAHGFPAVLFASLALGVVQPLPAQNDSGLSSGSGVGTGTGRSSTVEHPPGPATSDLGPRDEAGNPIVPDLRYRGDTPLGPGINVHFPDDPSLAPFLSLEESEVAGDAKGPMRINKGMLATANQLAEPGERGRVLLQIARGALLGNQLRLAHQAIEDAANAAVQEPNSLIHDQLIISIVTTAGLLSDSLLREAKPQISVFQDPSAVIVDAQRLEPDVAIRLARLEWRRSAYLAARTKNPTFRSEYLDRAAENMASGSATIALEYVRSSNVDDEKQGPTAEQFAEFKKQADEILVEAVAFAKQIERPIWKNQALERIATSAGESNQYERAVQVASGIENAEARARALMFVAEFQSRHNQNEGATQTYGLVAEAVASIPKQGLRGVLAGILIDSLITTGRFDDARACLVLYPTASERFVAMGAIAESQGARRMAESAREWIDRDVPIEYRSTLYRRLSNGILRAISEDRAKEFQNRDFSNYN